MATLVITREKNKIIFKSQGDLDFALAIGGWKQDGKELSISFFLPYFAMKALEKIKRFEQYRDEEF